MTEADLTRIESELGIRLHGEYRQLMVPFPIPAYAGNVDTELWDDADQLIALNRELRSTSWPDYLFALGRDGSGCANAIDLRDPTSPVWWADRCNLDAGSGENAPPLADWVKQYLADAQIHMEENGIDPNGPPEQRQRAEEASARSGCFAMLVVLVVSLLIVLIVWLVV